MYMDTMCVEDPPASLCSVVYKDLVRVATAFKCFLDVCVPFPSFYPCRHDLSLKMKGCCSLFSEVS